MLEKVQKSNITNPRIKKYFKYCKSCKIPTLHYMQIRRDMIEICKILSGKYDAAVIPRVNKELIYVTRANDLRLEKGSS